MEFDSGSSPPSQAYYDALNRDDLSRLLRTKELVHMAKSKTVRVVESIFQCLSQISIEHPNMQTINITMLQFSMNGEDLLHMAAEGGKLNSIVQLVECGFDLEAPNGYKYAALHHASSRDHARAVVKILRLGAAVDYIVDDGCSPLLVACQNDSPGAAIVLLAHGADPMLYSDRSRARPASTPTDIGVSYKEALSRGFLGVPPPPALEPEPTPGEAGSPETVPSLRSGAVPTEQCKLSDDDSPKGMGALHHLGLFGSDSSEEDGEEEAELAAWSAKRYRVWLALAYGWAQGGRQGAIDELLQFCGGSDGRQKAPWCVRRWRSGARRASRLAQWRQALEAERDAGLVFGAARDGRPLELQKRLRLGKLAGGLEREGEVAVGGVSRQVGPLEAARVGGHEECVRVLSDAIATAT